MSSRPPGREDARGDEQRVAGQEEAHEQPGLGEHDRNQAGKADPANQLGNVVDVVDEPVDDVLDEIHAGG